MNDSDGLFGRDRGATAIVAAQIDDRERLGTTNDFGCRSAAPGTHET